MVTSVHVSGTCCCSHHDWGRQPFIYCFYSSTTAALSISSEQEELSKLLYIWKNQRQHHPREEATSSESQTRRKKQIHRKNSVEVNIDSSCPVRSDCDAGPLSPDLRLPNAVHLDKHIIVKDINRTDWTRWYANFPCLFPLDVFGAAVAQLKGDFLYEEMEFAMHSLQHTPPLYCVKICSISSSQNCFRSQI